MKPILTSDDLDEFKAGGNMPKILIGSNFTACGIKINLDMLDIQRDLGIPWSGWLTNRIGNVTCPGYLKVIERVTEMKL